MLINLKHQGENYTYTVLENSEQYIWIDQDGNPVSPELSETLHQQAEDEGRPMHLFNDFAIKNMQKMHKKERAKRVRAPVKLFGNLIKEESKTDSTAIKLF